MVIEDEEPDWLTAASSECFGEAQPPPKRFVTIQPDRQVFVAQNRSKPQQHKRKAEAEDPPNRRVRHSPEKKPSFRAPLANGTNGQLGAPRRDLDSLISQHAKGFSTLIRKGLRGESKRKRPKAKQAAIALAAQRLEEQLGTSFIAVAAANRGGATNSQHVVQPWEQHALPQRQVFRQRQ